MELGLKVELGAELGWGGAGARGAPPHSLGTTAVDVGASLHSLPIAVLSWLLVAHSTNLTLLHHLFVWVWPELAVSAHSISSPDRNSCHMDNCGPECLATNAAG